MEKISRSSWGKQNNDKKYPEKAQKNKRGIC